MNLYTKHHDPSWDRTVYIYVDKCSGISGNINDSCMVKLLIVTSGKIILEEAAATRTVEAPALLAIPESAVTLSAGKTCKTTTVYFRPTEIREEFTLDRIRSGEFDEAFGRTIYQDYLLIRNFMPNSNKANIIKPGVSAFSKIKDIVRKMDDELRIQHDDFWPCRSRSYLMELLYMISFTGGDSDDYSEGDSDEDLYGEIVQYLSENLSEKITLNRLTKQFSINRNRLNEIFNKITSMTCMNYFVKMRIDLAKIMLAETQINISEISARVGYEDPNYFVKVFRKEVGTTPSQYRVNSAI